jgi:hypothetical protein
MAEWLRPGTLEGPHDSVAWDRTWTQIMNHKEVHIVRCDGLNHVRNSIWQSYPKLFKGQDGRVVKARDFGRYSRLSCV